MSPYQSERSWSVALTLGLVVLLAGAAAHGETVSFLAGNVGQTLITQEGMWDIQNALLTNGSIVGDAGEVWFIAPSGFAPPALFTWTGNLLATDLSTNGLADGLFTGGGTLTIEGQIWDLQPFPQLKYAGLLLEGVVQEFRMTETGTDTDFIDLTAWDGTTPVTTFTPTGGYLVGNGILEMAPFAYYHDATGQGCQQNEGEPLTNWVEPPVSCGQMEFVMTIPEPTSLATVGGLLACVAWRRRRAR
jgi:hypothetical protein